MNRSAALLLLLIVLLAALSWLLVGGNQIDTPLPPVCAPSSTVVVLERL